MRFKSRVLRTIVVARRHTTKIPMKVAKSVVLSTATEVIVHHKPPTHGDILLMDATVFEALDTCVRVIAHATHF